MSLFLLVPAARADVGWQELPNTRLHDVCPPDHFGGIPYEFNYYCPAVITAWNGGIADTSRNRLVLWGGGHGDYQGNELYALNLSNNSMTRLNDPSNFTLGSSTDCSTYKDGKPTSRHTYNALVYIEHLDKMYVFNGAVAPTGDCTSTLPKDTWVLDMGTLQWQRMDPANGGGLLPSQPYGVLTQQAVYDPHTQTVLLYYGDILWRYTYETNTYTVLSMNAHAPVNSTGVLDPKRKLYIFMGTEYQSTQPHVYAISYGGGHYDSQEWAVTGCDALAGVDYPGLQYDPVLDRIVGWPNTGNTVYLFNPDTKSCQAQTFPNGMNLSPGTYTGTFGHLRYFPSLNKYALVGHADVNAYTLQLNTDMPPGDPQAPTVPTGLTATAVSASQINLVWTASADNVGVAGYRIYRGGTSVGTTPSTSYSDTGLTAGAPYAYTVAAYDVAGNRSSPSASAGATTHPPTQGAFFIGRGCSTAYYIDKDCDGYGVGKRSDNDYNPGKVGDIPDADDNDATVNTPATWQAKYGSINGLLNKLGYSPQRIYYISPTGDDAAGVVNDINKPFKNFGALVSKYMDGQGGAIIFRGGTYNMPINGCYASYPCGNPSAALASNPLIIMAYPGESVELFHSAPMNGNTTYWPGKNTGNLIVDGLSFRSSFPDQGIAITPADGSNMIFRNNEYTHYAQGIFLGNHTQDAIIEESVFHDNDTHSVYLASSGPMSVPAVGDFDFVQDEINYQNGTSGGASQRITFRNNLIYRDGEDGYEPIHINTYAKDVNIEGNIIHSSGGTGVGFQTGIYNSTIKNNLIFNNASHGITFSVYGPTGQAATIRYNSIINNTIWTGRHTDVIKGQTPGAGILFNDFSDTPPGTHWIKDTIIRNNVIVTDNWHPIYGRKPLVFWGHSFPNTHIVENNLFFNNSGSPNPEDYIMQIRDDAYPTGQDAGDYTFEQFQAYSPNFRNNVVANPQFVDASLDYTLTPERFHLYLNAGSLAINAGTASGAPAIDLKGNARDAQPDIGAYEYNSSGGGPPPPGENPPPPETLPDLNLNDINNRVYRLNEEIRINHQPPAGMEVRYESNLSPVSPRAGSSSTSSPAAFSSPSSPAVVGGGPIATHGMMGSPPVAGGNDGRRHSGVTKISAFGTSNVPQFSLANRDLTPGSYTLAVTATGGGQTKSGSANITLVAADFSATRVYPNPWRADRHTGDITFSDLSTNTTVKIFTTSGHLVRELSGSGTVTWDRKNKSGDAVASGMYIFLIKDAQGNEKKGKLAIVR